jgi:hypothetical protein
MMLELDDHRLGDYWYRTSRNSASMASPTSTLHTTASM